MIRKLHQLLPLKSRVAQSARVAHLFGSKRERASESTSVRSCAFELHIEKCVSMCCRPASPHSAAAVASSSLVAHARERQRLRVEGANSNQTNPQVAAVFSISSESLNGLYFNLKGTQKPICQNWRFMDFTRATTPTKLLPTPR